MNIDMRVSYMEFACNIIRNTEIGVPIYTKEIARDIAEEYDINQDEADMRTADVIRDILHSRIVPEFRVYEKGIYYRTTNTPFGELRINQEQLIADKYLLPDIGYETGLAILHKIGLTTQMPRERIFATNVAKNRIKRDIKLGIVIKPPKTEVTAENKAYLQLLDVLDIMEKAPVDTEQPYTILAEYIRDSELKYGILLALAEKYYGKKTILRLARVASAGIELTTKY